MWDELARLAEARGIVLPACSQEQFAQLYQLLAEANKSLNLTRVTGQREVMVKHFLDSLEVLAWQPRLQGKILDVGSGAGFPGIPLKIARPELEIALIDSSQKKVNYLQKTIISLGLSGINAWQCRAEDLARQPQWRESFDIVTSRALAGLNILLELCLPLVKVGGSVIAYKGPAWQEELEKADAALLQLKATLVESWPYDLPFAMGERVLLIFSKTENTPRGFPRRAGIPRKRPLI